MFIGAASAAGASVSGPDLLATGGGFHRALGAGPSQDDDGAGLDRDGMEHRRSGGAHLLAGSRCGAQVVW